STIIGQKTVTVNPKPIASAGNNVSIPYGTTTTLHGYATGGSGSYTYQWTSSPSGFFSNLPEPITQNLDVTTLFTLVVTDVITGCISDPSQVIVTVTGFALNITPTAAKPA